MQADRLRELLSYDPDTGIFRWVNPPKNHAHRRGNIAGTETTHGYIHIKIDGKKRSAHRLAWLYSYGSEPSSEIDHINRDRKDNRLSNLREVDRFGNTQNHGKTTAPSGLPCGVRMLSSGRYETRITAFRVVYVLGTFATVELARQAYESARRELHAGIR